MYDVFLDCEVDTILVVAEGEIFGGDGCDKNDTLGTDTASETTLGAGAGWGATTIYCGVNSDGNMGGGGGEVSGISTASGEGMEELRSVAVCLIDF